MVQLRIIRDDARNLVLTVRPKEAKIFIFSPPPLPVFVVVPVVDIVGLEVNVAPDLHGGGNVVCRNNKLMGRTTIDLFTWWAVEVEVVVVWACLH